MCVCVCVCVCQWVASINILLLLLRNAHRQRLGNSNCELARSTAQRVPLVSFAMCGALDDTIISMIIVTLNWPKKKLLSYRFLIGHPAKTGVSQANSMASGH